MKTNVIALVLVAMAAAEQMITWAVAASFVLVLFLYIRLRMSDPYREIEDLKVKIKKMVEALAAEKVRVMDLTNRNDEIKTTLNTLHADHMELKGQFSQLNVAYGRLGEQFNKVMDELKKERELRDIQYAELVRNQAKHGDL